MIELFKIMKNMWILDSNMDHSSVTVRYWESKSVSETEEEIEHGSVDLNESGDKWTQSS